MRKKGRFTGFLQGLSFASRMNEIAFLVNLQRAIDNEDWKGEGFESLKDFCREVSGSSYETVHRRLSTIRALGPEVTSIMVSLGLGIKDAKMIEHAMVEDPKTGKKALMIDNERSIPFTEDRIEEIQSHIDIIRDKGRIAERKLSGIEREHKKETKILTKEIEDLRAQVVTPETPEEFAEAWQTIETRITEIAQITRKLKFDEAHKETEEGPIKAKYLVKIQAAERQFVSLIESMKEAVLAG